ncbi:MAG: choice-of-anchor Q domain-containing protein [Chthoniobacteraceae bacterium]
MLGTATLSLNLKLGSLQNNGGPTLTFALLPGSPAIDKGGNANLVSPACPPAGYPFLPPIISDQRGFISRILNGDFNDGHLGH